MTSQPEAGAIKWTLDEALVLCRRIQEAVVTTGYHVALGGGVLLRGYSHKDVDVFLYPNDSSYEQDRAPTIAALQNAGLRRRLEAKDVQAIWRRAGSSDNKVVEMWIYDGKRVDLFWVK